jgi:hypothetical protein
MIRSFDFFDNENWLFLKLDHIMFPILFVRIVRFILLDTYSSVTGVDLKGLCDETR